MSKEEIPRSEQERDKIAMRIGKLVLAYINPLVIQVSGHIQAGHEWKADPGTTTDKIKKEVEE